MPIAYAIEGEQHYDDLKTYKYDHPSPLTAGRLKLVTELFIREHQACLARLTGPTGPHVAVVPSTRGRTGPHPVVSLLPLRPTATLIEVTNTGRYPSDYRDFAADRFTVAAPSGGWISRAVVR